MQKALLVKRWLQEALPVVRDTVPARTTCHATVARPWQASISLCADTNASESAPRTRGRSTQTTRHDEDKAGRARGSPRALSQRRTSETGAYLLEAHFGHHVARLIALERQEEQRHQAVLQRLSHPQPTPTMPHQHMT